MTGGRIRKVLVIGLTGGIATGKSTVAEMLKELGAVVVDADRIAREVVEPGQPALAEIVATFGPEVLRPDGTLDRARLGERVFSDPEARRCLEAITHPRIIERIRAELERLRSEPGSEERIVVVEAPLLFESGIEGLMDGVVVVASEQKTQVERLMQRAHISPEQARQRIQAQWPLSEKIRRADWVITTDGPLEETRRQVRALWKQLQDKLKG